MGEEKYRIGDKVTGIWERLDRIDHRIVYIVLTIAVCAVIIQPFGVPVKISPVVQDIYNLIDGLQPGDIVHLDIAVELPTITDNGPGAADIIYHLHSKGVKVVYTTGIKWSGLSSTPTAYNRLVREWNDLDAMGKVYGVDYVYIGYLGATDVGYTSFATDLLGFTGNDYYGTPLNTLPLMQELPTGTYADFKMCIAIGDATAAPVLQPRYKTTCILWTQITTYPNYLVLVPHVLRQAGAGVRMAAEYERLLGRPARGARTVDTTAIAGLVVVGFMILGNIGLFMSRRKE
jgi:hypothetical protein